MIRAACLLALVAASSAFADMPVGTGPDRAARKLTCIYDGDTGWESGSKWRLLDIDAPEIGARDAGPPRASSVAHSASGINIILMLSGIEDRVA